MSNVFNDYDPPSLQKITGKNYKALLKYGDKTAQLLHDIGTRMAPQEQALQLSLLQQYGPLFAKAGQDLASQEAEAGIARDLSLAQGSGRKLVGEALSLDQLANPEFYSNRAAVGSGYDRLLAAMSPDSLSGAELSNVERGVNRLNARTGNLNTGDATTTTANAMMFGNELAQKQSRFADALALFPGISAASRVPIDTFQVATGKSSMGNNIGLNQFNPTDGRKGLQDMQKTIADSQQTQLGIKSGRRNFIDYATQIQGSLPSCCFIMISAAEGVELPKSVRDCRDYFYEKEPIVREGYKKMAKWLVPLMDRYVIIRKAIKYTMYYPLVEHAKYLTGEPTKIGKLCTIFNRIWFNIWRNI